MSYTPGPLPIPDRSMWQYGVKTDHFTAEQLSAHTAAEVARAVAAERERSAKVCDQMAVIELTGYGIAEDCAAAIRADPQRLQGAGE